MPFEIFVVPGIILFIIGVFAGMRFNPGKSVEKIDR